MNRPHIEETDFCHVFNRGTEKRDVFMDTADRKKFIAYLNVLNDLVVARPCMSETGEGEDKNIKDKERHSKD